MSSDLPGRKSEWSPYTFMDLGSFERLQREHMKGDSAVPRPNTKVLFTVMIDIIPIYIFAIAIVGQVESKNTLYKKQYYYQITLKSL